MLHKCLYNARSFLVVNQGFIVSLNTSSFNHTWYFPFSRTGTPDRDIHTDPDAIWLKQVGFGSFVSQLESELFN